MRKVAKDSTPTCGMRKVAKDSRSLVLKYMINTILFNTPLEIYIYPHMPFENKWKI